VKSSR